MIKALLDTNIIARFLIGDVENQQKEVNSLFNKAVKEEYKLYILPETLIELRYVLSTHYEFSKQEIVEALQEFLDLGIVEMLNLKHLDFNLVLKTFNKENLSFEDSLYLQVCLQNSLELISFDKLLSKVYIKYKEI
jgi:predicted nucleic acid-binding protein